LQNILTILVIILCLNGKKWPKGESKYLSIYMQASEVKVKLYSKKVVNSFTSDYSDTYDLEPCTEDNKKRGPISLLESIKAFHNGQTEWILYFERKDKFSKP